MKTLGIIPARFASTRFPGKPLIEIAGKTMIQRVYEQCKKSNMLSDVIVATDDDRIYNHVCEFGGKAIMTAHHHQSGTDRCAEAVRLSNINADVVINIQGDEPFISPLQIDLLANCFKERSTQIATLIKKIKNQEDLKSPTVMKVVFNNNNEALYFSRSAIPFCRAENNMDNWLNHFDYFKHIGIYAFRTEVLNEITEIKPSSLELTESLEQLRWLQNGYKIKVAETEEESISIDVPEDLIKIERFI